MIDLSTESTVRIIVNGHLFHAIVEPKLNGNAYFADRVWARMTGETWSSFVCTCSGQYALEQSIAVNKHLSGVRKFDYFANAYYSCR